MADLPVGSLTHRWLNWTPKEALPAHLKVRVWYERLVARPAVNAKRTREIAAHS